MPIPKTIPRAVFGMAPAWAAIITGDLASGAGAMLGLDIALPMSKAGSGGCMTTAMNERSIEKEAQVSACAKATEGLGMFQ